MVLITLDEGLNIAIHQIDLESEFKSGRLIAQGKSSSQNPYPLELPTHCTP